ncbi:MAG: hypothetical protein ACTSSQ_07200, partial [Alphaproteobacteria bacterium]
MISAALLAVSAVPGVGSAKAQTIEPGQAFVSQFGGFAGNTGMALDPDGAVGVIIDLRNPGKPAAGQAWRSAPLRPLATAAQVGQVFGIAFDNKSPANIYVAASTAYGAYQRPGGVLWQPGQWGVGGGPGTIYKLDASNNYAPALFAEISLGGRANTGAALGNIAFGAVGGGQLFVSDLESGMIQGIGLDGAVRGTYDHGQTGRAAFLDVTTGENTSLAPVAFDPSSAARRTSCPTAFARSPECWNIADFRRRIWGLAVHADPSTGASRLYYAVWSSQGFGNPQWAADPADQSNTIWSVGLTAGGDFDTSDIRREFTVPGFFAGLDDFNRAGPSNPITDIAISAGGDMLLGERGGVRKLADGPRDGLVWPHESRVLLYRRDESGLWLAAGRHDIGNADRADIGQPHLRASTAGGVAFGNGYSTTGNRDAAKTDAFAWATGDELCQLDAPCLSNTAVGEDSAPLAGLQGQPANTPGEVSPAAAYADYPEPGPATPADVPARSYFVETVKNAGSGWAGDVEVYTGAAAPSGPPDLSVSKSMPAFCATNNICTARVTVTNIGAGIWSGPLYLRDVTRPAGLAVAAVGAPWTCTTVCASRYCHFPPVVLASGESRTLIMDLVVPPSFTEDQLTNCA